MGVGQVFNVVDDAASVAGGSVHSLEDLYSALWEVSRQVVCFGDGAAIGVCRYFGCVMLDILSNVDEYLVNGLIRGVDG